MFENVKIIFLDVDGVLTSGEVYVSGKESPRIMYVRDRLALKALKEKSSEDIKIYWVTARPSKHLKRAARELKMDGVYTGVSDKLKLIRKILSSSGIEAARAMYVGDDLVDMSCMKFCGSSCAPRDATPEIKKIADFISTSPGGRGAVREIIEKILKERGKWGEIVRKFDQGS